jgi:hypothetical protein
LWHGPVNIPGDFNLKTLNLHNITTMLQVNYFNYHKFFWGLFFNILAEVKNSGLETKEIKKIVPLTKSTDFACHNQKQKSSLWQICRSILLHVLSVFEIPSRSIVTDDQKPLRTTWICNKVVRATTWNFLHPDAEIYSFQVLWVDFPKLPLKMAINIKVFK